MLFEDAVLEPGTRALLKPLGEALAPEGFFLAGGTALAIQFGHRRSIDLDFFTRNAFDPDAILKLLVGSLSSQAVLVTGRAMHSLNLAISGVKVDAIRYDYPLLEPLVEAEGYSMLAPPDIAAMKLSAITNRGSRKDFYDVFFLLEPYPLEQQLAFYQRKFPNHDAFFVIRSLAYFDDAEAEPEPALLRDVSWNRVKEAVTAAVRSLG